MTPDGTLAETEQVCGSCARFAERPVSDASREMPPPWGKCDLLPAWHTVSPYFWCRFSPAQWQRKPAE